jgi:cytoskeletal protein CcmA (bactofilin family)
MDTRVARLSDKYGFDIMDGREVPRLVVTGDYTLSRTHQGGVHVESGQFRLEGTLQGSLDLQCGAAALIRGTQQGSVAVAEGAIAVVTGAIQGSVHVYSGGTVIIEGTGRLAGSLSNDGEVVVRGVFGGSYSGDGQLRLEGDGHIKQPRVRDGVSYYEW